MRLEQSCNPNQSEKAILIEIESTTPVSNESPKSRDISIECSTKHSKLWKISNQTVVLRSCLIYNGEY